MRISRVCGAILNEDRVLMVQHKEKDRIYWTFPGGAVEYGEKPEEAVIREVNEETGLHCKLVRVLFDEILREDESLCRCFLLERMGREEPVIGYDPEEMHLPEEERMLRGISWKSIIENREDRQIASLIKEIDKKDYRLK